MALKQEEMQKSWVKVIVKAWSDPAFKKKLLQNPEDTLKKEGLGLPKGMHVEIHENNSRLSHLTLPEQPANALANDQLLKVAAGFTWPNNTIP